MSSVHKPLWLSDDDIEEIPFQNENAKNLNSTSNNVPTWVKEQKNGNSSSENSSGSSSASRNKILFWIFRIGAILLSFLMLCTSFVGLSKYIFRCYYLLNYSKISS